MLILAILRVLLQRGELMKSTYLLLSSFLLYSCLGQAYTPVGKKKSVAHNAFALALHGLAPQCATADIPTSAQLKTKKFETAWR